MTPVDILLDKIGSRGLFVGGFAHPFAKVQVGSDHDWPLAYWREWVKGDDTAQVPSADKNGVLSQNAKAVQLLARTMPSE